MAKPESNTANIDKSQRSPAWSEVYLGGGMLVFSLILIWWLIPGYIADFATGDDGLSPRFFPYLVTIIIGLLSTVLIIRNIRLNSFEKSDRRLDRSTWVCIGLLIAYQQSIVYIGLSPASFLALAGLMFLYGFRNWLVILPFSGVVVIGLSLFFELVALVPLPRGILFEGIY